MVREPSPETALRNVKRLWKESEYAKRSWEQEARKERSKAEHYRAVLLAIAEGKYPGKQAALAASHALSAWSGR